MYEIIDKLNIFLDNSVKIIFNPVGVISSRSKSFNNYLKELYPKVYDEYLEYITDIENDKLLGDIQLIQVNDNQFILNAFVFDKKSNINYIALCKTLVELFNIGENYQLNIAVPYYAFSRNETVKEKSKLIVDTIFEDYKYEVYIYKSLPYTNRK